MRFVLLILWCVGFTVFMEYAFAAPDQFVQMLEARMQVSPGSTKVLPECGCTIQYLGTTVHGRHYTVQLDRLD